MMKKLFLFTCIALILFISGCNVDETPTKTTATTTTTLEPGSCIDAADCEDYCRSSTKCEQQYNYYHIGTGCLDGICKCTCISDELPPVISPEGEEFTYRDRVYVKTDEVMECSGSLTKVGNYTLWEESYNGYIYSAKEINIAENRYICYRWFEKPGVIIRVYDDEVKQDQPFGFDAINVDIKERNIEPPFYQIERLVDGNWSEVDRVSCPCGTECENSPLTLEPGKRHAYRWNNRIEYCNQSTLVSASNPPGVYRVKIYLDGGDVTYSKKFEIKPDINLEMITDKEVYSSQELMEITVNIKSGGFLGNVSLRVFGISGKSQSMDIERKFDLDKGNRSFSFNYLIPYCSTKSCTSVEPGPYYVKAVLLYEDAVIALSGREVRIEPSGV
ncbi:MAG: hypothetical protein B6U72_05895 [Candidatus Altiarchaeales archaeon ex4484_2]|nr:MAG: hypothetical protein B6U72_05895 [Candidatus Altiarchaeales archaeon ex4484_2]